jgi:hypothetical protein
LVAAEWNEQTVSEAPAAAAWAPPEKLWVHSTIICNRQPRTAGESIYESLHGAFIG